MQNNENKTLVVNPNRKEIYNIYDFLNFNQIPQFGDISLPEIALYIDEFIEFFNTECIFEDHTATRVQNFNKFHYNLKRMFQSIKIESHETIQKR